MAEHASGLIALTPYEARTVAAVFERLFPADDQSPGAVAIGALTFLDRALSGAYQHQLEAYKLGLAALDRCARTLYGAAFAHCNAEQQDALLAALQDGCLPAFQVPEQPRFFYLLLGHLQEGLFADPAHGGNRDKLGWRFLGHPGIWLANSAEENLAPTPVTKGGEIRTLADAGYTLRDDPPEPVAIFGYDPQRSVVPPTGPADVVIVGMGAVGAFIAPILAQAGLQVVALDPGSYRTRHDFSPDELGSAYYARGEMGAKFLSETPRWRRNLGEPTREATFSLGRMLNSVGGSVIHWGGALRRMHPHHFRFLSHIRETCGQQALPEQTTLADWPISYDELEPYYVEVEYLAGVAGDNTNQFLHRSQPYPMPPLRTFTKAELFKQGSEALGLHPYPTPVCMNSIPYNGLPATSYHAWSAGFGSFDDDRWNPSLTSVPQALASGNLDLRTHCRVVRVLTDADGHTTGVEYVDANGNWHLQEARTVILASYTFENVRLMFLSGDSKRPDGLGNSAGQLGKHFMLKQWADVYGYFPEVVFNAHTGPAAQMWSLDDFISADFDCYGRGGFIGGATPNIENQCLPLQIARDPVPPEIRCWGQPYKDHLRQWQQIAAVRIQPDSLSYHSDFLDLDPRYRDRSGLGLPLIRITTDMRPNEQRLHAFMQTRAEEILHAMGASKTWPGPRLKGVVSSHDLGGCRMGEDPTASVVDPELQVHDTPGLYVFGGAVFPTCNGVNPQLTIWALCKRAAERLAARLWHGE